MFLPHQGVLPACVTGDGRAWPLQAGLFVSVLLPPACGDKAAVSLEPVGLCPFPSRKVAAQEGRREGEHSPVVWDLMILTFSCCLGFNDTDIQGYQGEDTRMAVQFQTCLPPPTPEVDLWLM